MERALRIVSSSSKLLDSKPCRPWRSEDTLAMFSATLGLSLSLSQSASMLARSFAATSRIAASFSCTLVNLLLAVADVSVTFKA